MAGIGAKNNGFGCGAATAWGAFSPVPACQRSDEIDLSVINGAEVEDRRLVGIAAKVGFEAILTDAARRIHVGFGQNAIAVLS